MQKIVFLVVFFLSVLCLTFLGKLYWNKHRKQEMEENKTKQELSGLSVEWKGEIPPGRWWRPLSPHEILFCLTVMAIRACKTECNVLTIHTSSPIKQPSSHRASNKVKKQSTSKRLKRYSVFATARGHDRPQTKRKKYIHAPFFF